MGTIDTVPATGVSSPIRQSERSNSQALSQAGGKGNIHRPLSPCPCLPSINILRTLIKSILPSSAHSSNIVSTMTHGHLALNYSRVLGS